MDVDSEATEPGQRTLTALVEHLDALPAGRVRDPESLERVLAPSWAFLSGNKEGGTESSKLHRRIEDATWHPPLLEFDIERHGTTVMGSTRAEVQHWVVDVVQRQAEMRGTTARQVHSQAPRLDVRPLADSVAMAIVSGKPAPALKRKPDGSVRVLIGNVIPASSGFKQTIAGRRRRFWDALRTRLDQEDWEAVSADTFRKKSR